MFNIYSKTLFLRRGVLLKILINYECNLQCPYCNLKLITGSMPQGQTSTIDEWMGFIERFPVKIKEVTIEGGEPTLYPGIETLTNKLLDKGYHVRFYTNLVYIDELKKVKRSYRFRVIATFHKTGSARLFVNNYMEVKKRYSIVVYEIGSRIFRFSRLRPLQIKAEELPDRYFFITPNRNIYIGLQEALKNLKL